MFRRKVALLFPVLLAATLGTAVVTGAAVLSNAPPAQALENGLARTPQMGWNDWNTFGCNVNDSADPADRRRHGLQRHGGRRLQVRQHRRLLVDQAARRQRRPGRPTRTKFPSGIKALADYVHGKGLKLGIYSSAGTTTCAGYPASLELRGSATPTSGRPGASTTSSTTTAATTRAAAASSATPRCATRSPATGRHDPLQPLQLGPGQRLDLGRAGGQLVAHHRRHRGQLGLGDGHPRPAGRPGERTPARARWNDPDMLEVGNGGLIRDRVAGALQPLGAAQRAADRRQRPAHHVARRPGRS